MLPRFPFFSACVLMVLIASQPVFADSFYSGGVKVSPDASERELGIADDLAGWLKKATGKEFTVGTEGGGIVLAVDSDDPRLVNLVNLAGRDAFAVNAGADGVWIVGRTGLALENGVHWWLDRLGFRWLHASEKWTVVPRLSDLQMEIDTVQSPAFAQRGFFGTGGFGVPAMDPKQRSVDIWREYQRRNLLTGQDPEGIRLGGHAGEGFVLEHKDTLRENPEFLALLDGARQDVDKPRGVNDEEGWQPVELSATKPGVYTMEVRDRVNSFRLKLPEGLPFVCTEGLRSVQLSERLFFYVPPGTRQIAVHTPGVIPLKIYDPDGSLVTVPANEDHKNVFLIDVPEGQDGKAWSFAQFNSFEPLVLLNCPNNFAWSAETLMIPQL